MKTINITTIILIIAFTMACTDPIKKEVSKVVSEHEQTIGNSKIDLNLNIKSVEKANDFFAKDSLEILSKYLNEKKEEKLKNLNESLKSSIEDSARIANKINKEKYEILKDGYKKDLEFRIELIEQSREFITLYNTDFKGTFLESTYKSIKKYEQKPDEKLYSTYKVVYTINNPMLNNALQEITNFYLIKGNPENVESEPLKIIDKKDSL